jgi:hypothetical protein
MNNLKLGCFGIELDFDKSDIGGACISSDMKESDIADNLEFNAAVDGLESIILAHFCAGIDVSDSAYLEGIEVAYLSIANNLDGSDSRCSEPSKVVIQKSRNFNASADEVIHYEVDAIDWNMAIEKYGNEETALFELQRELKVKVVLSEVDVNEVHEEFDVRVVII